MGRLSIQRETLDVGVLLQRLVDAIEPTLDVHTIELACPDTPLMIAGDALRLEQVFQNLIHNAIKYSPDGGLITVQLEQRHECACIAVCDQGIGIPHEAQAQLFQQFYRAANAEEYQVQGLGIGLYIVKEIITLHDGDVEVESHPGEGSIFRVYLPLSHGTLAPQASAAQRERHQAGG